MALPEEIIASEAVISGYIPQKEPMIMIGKLLSTGNGKTRTSFLIRLDNLFCETGFFLEAGLIENMAQTAAAGVGYEAKREAKAPPVGFIGGVKNFKVFDLPRIGDEIETEITVEHQVFDATVVLGKVFKGSALMAECELKIFIIKN
jgi:hypothetical protein